MEVEKKSKSKYGNKKTKIKDADGVEMTFDSKREAEVYVQRVALRNRGVIKNLVRQPVIILQKWFKDGNGKTVQKLTYRWDFWYEIASTGRRILEDVKWYVTDVYRLKKKLVQFKIMNKSIPYDEFIETK